MKMSKNLNENQLLAVQLVAQGRSGREIAKQLSVTEETISRWKKQPFFIASVNEILGQLREGIQQKMRNLIFQALEILETELSDKENKNKANIALKLLQNYKFVQLFDQKIGSDNPEIIKRIILDKKNEALF